MFFKEFIKVALFRALVPITLVVSISSAILEANSFRFEETYIKTKNASPAFFAELKNADTEDNNENDENDDTHTVMGIAPSSRHSFSICSPPLVAQRPSSEIKNKLFYLSYRQLLF